MKLSRTQKEILENQLKNEKEIIQNIKAAYREALEQIDNRIIQLQVQIGDIQRSDKTDTVISSMIQSKIYQKQYQQALKDQVSGILDQLNGSQFNSINEYLTKCYTDGYISTMYDLTSRGIPIIMPIDQKAVVQALSTNSKLSKSLYESLGENIKNMKKKVVAEIARGIASSLPYAEIARNISGRSNAGMNNSIRIARTEGQRIRNTASYEAQVKAKEKGADIVKQWCATLDGRTRGSHRHLDGKIVEIDEKFKIGNKSAMFPGDFGDPAEDCNCRCCILQRAKWDLDEAELNTLKKRAEYYGLDKTESFDDFRTKYIKAVENTEQSIIIKSKELTDIEVKAINDYISAKSYIINNKLRTGEKLLPEEKELIENLDSALDKMPAYEGNLQRSLFFYSTEDIDSFMKVYKIGETVTYSEFLSTTKGDIYNPEGQVQIYIQDTKTGKDISSINDREQEIIYERDSSFEVVNIVYKEGVYYILLGEKR